MGNTYCAGAREKFDEKQQATMHLYTRLSEQMKRKYEHARKNTKEKYTVTKLKAQGYSLNHFEDNGETKVITDFENKLALRLVPLDIFDHHITKL